VLKFNLLTAELNSHNEFIEDFEVKLVVIESL